MNPSDHDITVFAQTNFRGMQRKFGIKRDDRRRHMYLVGKTGMGKSTTLENMIINDIRNGQGVAVVDPHGDLAEKIMKYIPSNRVNDVVYFNPADTKFPVAFNILENVSDDYKHLVAYGLVGVFKKIWADSWGPRMEYILTNTILALLDYPGSTLLGVMRLLVDKSYRKKVVAKITDPVVKTFWSDEFANYSEKFRTEAIAPIQNKVGQFLASSIIRNIVGQSKSTIEMRDIMDNQKILIMNLAKGRVGEENSALLGAMMITKIQIAAMSRVDIPEEERKDFYLYVDEFQNFATESFAGILSEARKYRLNLIMAHQYLEQLGDEVKAAVFGNVGTMIVFRVGATDALEMEPEFGPQFVAQDIVNINKYNFIIRLMIDGIATEPFSAIGMPPASGEENNDDKVIKVSRERYARPQDIVEDRIIRWSGVEITPAMQRLKADQAEASASASDDEDGDDYQMDEDEDEDEDKKNAYTSSNDSTEQEKNEVADQNTAAAQRLAAPSHFIPDIQGQSEPLMPKMPAVVITETTDHDIPDAELSEKPKRVINFIQTELPADDTMSEPEQEPESQPEPLSKPQVVSEPVELSDEPKEAAAVLPEPPGVSLSDLKQGNVATVAFTPEKSAPEKNTQAKTPEKKPAPSQPTTPTQSTEASNADKQEKKRKRRRRKRSGGSGEQADNQPRPQPAPVQPQQPQSKPQPQAQEKTESRPQPNQSPSQPTPTASSAAQSAADDKTKVSLGDLM